MPIHWLVESSTEDSAGELGIPPGVVDNNLRLLDVGDLGGSLSDFDCSLSAIAVSVAASVVASACDFLAFGFLFCFSSLTSVRIGISRVVWLVRVSTSVIVAMSVS